jgi:phosphatidate cytidylyltransferase
VAKIQNAIFPKIQIMQSVFYYIPVYLFLGALGMAIAGRKATPTVRRQRWLKYFFYILITGVVIASIFLRIFEWLAVLIIAAGFVELLSVNMQSRDRFSVLSILVFGIIATGFIFFGFRFTDEALLFIYFQVLVFDAFGQITGQLFGKHALVPKLSPAKTVEGFAGSMFFCIASSLLGAEWVGISTMTAILYGLVTGLTCLCGDLLASWFKRQKKIKDYSNWLPAQGGILDRFDSFIFTGFIYYVISIFIRTPFIK